MTLFLFSSKDRTDIDVIRENHQFLWEDDESSSWGKRLAKKYWDKLYKEYTICDLSRYKEKKVAFRWRIEKEVNCIVHSSNSVCVENLFNDFLL